MKKFLRFSGFGLPIIFLLFIFHTLKKVQTSIPTEVTVYATVDKEENEEEDGYDEAAARDQFEFEQIKDPALGYVPMERMMRAVEYTETSKQRLRTTNRNHSTLSMLPWIERGPIYDLVGANGNSRGGVTNYTAGRTKAILIDTLNDPTGNTVFCGGVAGGLWKCTNFLSAIPNWQPINDRFDNLAISSICQDLSMPSTLYFCTGEATSNADAVYGGGVWKSTNTGATWTKLAATTTFIRGFKIVCDAAGNVYLANRNTTAPASSASGLYRSKDGGASWQSITPAIVTSGNRICTDIEISTTGRLHASFGYSAGRVEHQYTDDAANVTPATGWNTSVGIRINTAVVANRLELATLGNILYGVTINLSNNVDSCYKSIDGGVSWTKQNATAYTPNVTNTQGWYDLTLAINPSNANEFLVGGLDAYKSVNSGSTVSRQTFWVGTLPYVHADHHFMQWWNAGAQSRIVIGGDGGIFVSNDGGTTFSDKNRNLAIKQFYAGAIHPTAGSPYLLAGAQDNGVHALTNAGLSFSTEVYGGDGCFVHINQQNPQIQFGSYVNNVYRRSTDGGATWGSVNFSSTNGLFVNPFDYDDGQNTMYASWGVSSAPNNQILRWTNANAGTAASILTLNALTRTSNSNATAFKVSPYTKDRVYIGSSRGKVVRLDSAGTVSAATANANVTDITGASFPVANLSCVNTGSADSVLVAVFTNYGVPHVWYSTNAGTSWANIDGNLPDMPVRWAMFDPQHDNRMFLATEAGVYYTDAINGSSTVWASDPNFPTVKTNMLKLRASDNTVVAATHGRGLYTAVIPATPEIRLASSFLAVTETTAGTTDCRGYKDYTVNVSAIAAPTGDATVTYSVKAGNTATEGVDFDFTANGDFVTPSKQQVFSTGLTTAKTIIVRIYDDAAIEPDETFEITFAVSGSTNAIAGAYKNLSILIKDNDITPIINVAPVSYSVGTNTVSIGGVNSASTFESAQQKHRVQVLFKASELTALGATAGDITSITTRVITKNSTQPFKGYTISMANTNATNLSSNFISGLTQVYTADYSSTVGDNTFVFGTGSGSAAYFSWNGTSNIVIQFCFDNTPNTPTTLPDVMEGSNPFGVGGAAANFATIYSNGGASAGCTLGAAYIDNERITAKFSIGKVGNLVETALNASKNAYLSPNDDVYFYGSNGNILARIKNLSGSNYACTQVSIDRAGTVAQPFWNNNPANYLTAKSLQVVPTTNHPSGTYQITLYYTAAEKTGWEAATGQSWDSIQIVKVKSQISKYSPATPLPDGLNAVETAKPVFGTFGADYTLTATFSTGFSGFAAGIPGLPVPFGLTTFTGRIENGTAVLTWSTSAEINTRNFDIEKSIDGINYFKIGSVNAAGNSVIKKDYAFRDDKLSPLNYYRLRMNDLSGNFTHSNSILLEYTAATQNLWVLTNPFNSYIDLRMAKPATKAKLQLISFNGSIVAEKSLANTTQEHWIISNHLSSGAYILRADLDGKLFKVKLIKQ